MELSQCKERLDAWFSDKEPEMLSMLERIVTWIPSQRCRRREQVGEVVTGWPRSRFPHGKTSEKARTG
ncbi:MAG: hypothetical protein ACLR0N_08505 [Bilophila wadsworthia]